MRTRTEREVRKSREMKQKIKTRKKYTWREKKYAITILNWARKERELMEGVNVRIEKGIRKSRKVEKQENTKKIIGKRKDKQ